ncbi:MAG: histidinol-phosphate transaminase [Candidatus Acidiferrales bacterium]
MDRNPISRRNFTQSIAATLAAVVAAPRTFAARPDALSDALAPEDVIKLSANENPYGPSQKAIEAITRSESVAMRYPEVLRPRTMEAIAKLHGVKRENVLLGCGSTEILHIADLAFVGTQKKLVVAEPTFESIAYYADQCRAQTLKVPLTADHRLDLPKMAEACDATVGLVYVCNPNNPTGGIVKRAELRAFLHRVPVSTVVLVDEAYYHFVEDPDYASAFEWFGKYPNLVLARTFSKVYGMAGMRLGYSVASKELTEAMSPHILYFSANAAVLAAAIASLEDPQHVPQMRKRLNDTRRAVVAELERQGRSVIPSETNFIMVDLGGDVAPVIAQFRARKIDVGRKFPSMPNWLRVSIGTPEQMAAFEKALNEIVPMGAARAA